VTFVPSPARVAPDPLAAATGWAVLPQDTVVATQADAVRFVDNFVTAAVSQLASGGGSEAFFTDVRGWVLALAMILRTEEGLEIVADAGLGPRLREHLDRYHIREQVSLVDASAETAAMLVAGPAAAAAVRLLIGPDAELPAAELDHLTVSGEGGPLRIVRVTSAGAGRGQDGYWIRGPRGALDSVARALAAAGLPMIDEAALAAARIAAGYPAAADIPEKTLPQELGRDQRAISFTKGCYLGQETVARLDALGHVNRRLVLLAIESPQLPVCPAGIELGTETVGTLTSSCLLPGTARAGGLGIVHRRALESAALSVANAAARVIPFSNREA
jgi:tRNA-modifying protein YgfZ